MSPLDDIPLWLAIPVAGLVMLGATLTLIGAWGFLRMNSFYDRLHAPTLASSWGTGGVILGSALLASSSAWWTLARWSAAHLVRPRPYLRSREPACCWPRCQSLGREYLKHRGLAWSKPPRTNAATANASGQTVASP